MFCENVVTFVRWMCKSYSIFGLFNMYLFFFFPSLICALFSLIYKIANARTVFLHYTSIVPFFYFFFVFVFVFVFVFFFPQVLNSCYNTNLVCSIGIIATMFWFQPLHCCCFLFFSFLFSLLFFRRNIILSTLFYFIFYFLYIKLLVNTINCHNIFALVDMLIPYRLK